MSKQKQTEQEFSKLRSALWPIYNSEVKKFLPMGLMMFFIIFVYFIVRNAKDTQIINEAQGSGLIPYLKAYVVMPCAILFVLAYSKLLNIFNSEKVFYIVVTFFLAFFGLFAAVIYPNLNVIHPDQQTVLATVEALELVTFFSLPIGQFLIPFVKIWGMWSYAAFYVFAELWGSSMISLLFWQFANQITRTEEAKRFYPMFGLLANLAPITAGLSAKYFNHIVKTLPAGVDPWGYTLDYLMTFVVLSGVAVLLIYRWMHTSVLTDTRYYDAGETSGKAKKKKPKLSVGESFKLILRSKYLGLIAMLVLAYGVSINLIELVWKNQLSIAFPDKNALSEFINDFFIATGIATMILIMFFKGIVAKFGWLRGAIITPLITVITGGLFFAFILFQGYMEPLIVLTGASALALSVWLGTAQNVLSKGVKYSLFDPTKEMAYIPLDEESKTKGKAAVDVIGGRLGKAGGGYIASFLLPFFAGDVLAASPVLFGIVSLVVGLWVLSVFTLNKEYQQKLAEQKS